MTRNDQSETNLTAKQEEFIAALLSQPSIAAAARSIDLPDKTARRWLKLDHFKEAYHAAKQDRFTNALEMLQSGVSVAIKTLHKNMTSDEVPAGVQVRAAQIWIELATETYQRNELNEKQTEILKKLEQLGVKP